MIETKMKTVYLNDGAEVRLIEKLSSGGYLVQGYYEYFDGGKELGDKFVVDRIYDSPPVVKKSEEVKVLQSMIDNLKKDKSTLIQEINQLKTSKINLISEIKKSNRPDLENTLLVLQGKANFAVVDFYYTGLKIGPTNEILFKEENGYEKGFLRLCSLIWDPTANQYWINCSNYKTDTSTEGSKIIFAETLEQAKEKAKDYVYNQDHSDNKRLNLLRSLLSYGIEIKSKDHARIQELEKLNKQREEEARKQKIEKLKAELKTLELK